VSARAVRALRAVSFDAAGTLIHPVRPVGELYALVAARHGVSIDPGELHERFRQAFASAPPLAFPGSAPAELHAHEKAWWRSVVRRVFAGIRFPDFDAYFDDLFAFFADGATWRADPDSVPLLDELRRRGLRILIISNFDTRVRGILDALGLAPFVDRVTLSSEAGAAKPDPTIFRVALDAENVDPAEVLHVGDTVREDWAGARAAAIEVVLIGPPELATDAPGAVVVPRLGAVAEIVAARPRRD